MLKRWKVTCAYDGTDYEGWQSQPSGNTVQDILEQRLQSIFKENIRIQGSGRTDSGVHARGQVFHFDASWKSDDVSLKNAIKATLPTTIMIHDVKKVAHDFHARFSATGKVYSYRFYLGEVPPHLSRYYCGQRFKNSDLSLMKDVLNQYLGWHDFRSFACNRGKPYEDTKRFVAKTELYQHGKQVRLCFEGNGFLYKMVRTLAGACFQVQHERITVSEVENLLSGNLRGHEIVTAPAHGLSLDKVYYKSRNYPPKRI